VTGGIRLGFAAGAADAFQSFNGSGRGTQAATVHCSKSNTILSESVNR
jgi:hypothetical protein